DRGVEMFEHLLSGNFSFAVVGGILLAPPAVPFLLPLARRSASARIARFLEEPRYWGDAEWRIDAACALLRSLPRAQRAAVKRFVQIVAHTDEGPNDEGSLREYRSQLITSFEAEWIRSERLTTPSPLERRRMLAILLLRLDVP